MLLKYLGNLIEGIFIGFLMLFPLVFVIELGFGYLWGSIYLMLSWGTMYIIYKRDKEGYVPKGYGWF